MIKATTNKTIERKIDGYSDRAIRVKIGHWVFCVSYWTLVAGKNLKTGKFYRFWGGYSKTTLNHIAFAGLGGICKKEWENMEVSKLPKQFKKSDIMPFNLENRTISGYSNQMAYYNRTAYGF